MSPARIHPRCKSRNESIRLLAAEAAPPTSCLWETPLLRAPTVVIRSLLAEPLQALFLSHDAGHRSHRSSDNRGCLLDLHDPRAAAAEAAVRQTVAETLAAMAAIP